MLEEAHDDSIAARMSRVDTVSNLGMRIISLPSLMDGFPNGYTRTDSAICILKTAVWRDYTSTAPSVAHRVQTRNHERNIQLFSKSLGMMCPRWLRAVVLAAALLVFIISSHSSASPLTSSLKSTSSGNINQPSLNGNSTTVLLCVDYSLLDWSHTDYMPDKAILVP